MTGLTRSISRKIVKMVDSQAACPTAIRPALAKSKLVAVQHESRALAPLAFGQPWHQRDGWGPCCSMPGKSAFDQSEGGGRMGGCRAVRGTRAVKRKR